jgi:thiamine-monophosphate kinase
VTDLKLRDLGERKVVELILDILGNSDMDITGMMDDCAVMDLGDEYLLITTDMISQHTHIPDRASPWHIGWHVIAVNLSDIAAMGGRPQGIVVALGLQDNFDVELLEKLVEGMKACAEKFGISIFGGDTKQVGILTLSGCAFGKVAKSHIMLRKGATPGDVVAVTGELGRAASAYHALENNIDEEKALRNLLEIHPRIKEGIVLSKTGAVTSCMDISDGLASSIYQLSTLNGVGFEIDLSEIPVSDEAIAISKQLHMPLWELALYFGGDYELLVTLNPDGFEASQKALADIGTSLTPIGKVQKETKNTLIKDRISSVLEDRGYEHFR